MTKKIPKQNKMKLNEVTHTHKQQQQKPTELLLRCLSLLGTGLE